MARVCTVCAKGPVTGHNVSHANNRTNRRWYPNLQTVRMLVEGHSDHSSAKRMGVSTRTYAGYVAALKEEYGATTRFQLGHTMAQQPARPRRTGARPRARLQRR